MKTPKTELVEATVLKPHPRNYKKHPDEQIAHIFRSIQEHGFYRHVVTAKDLTILAGHGVVEAVLRMGIAAPKVPIIRLNIAPDDPRAIKVMVGDNELGKFAETDDRALTELLRDVLTVDDILGTGYDEMQLAGLLLATRPESELRDVNAAAEYIGMPEYDPVGETFRVVVHCATPAEREAFMKALNQTVINKKTEKVWSIWYPERQKEDLSAARFASGDLFDMAAEEGVEL